VIASLDNGCFDRVFCTAIFIAPSQQKIPMLGFNNVS